MKLPWLFRQIHQRELEVLYYNYGAIFKVVPKEPLGRVTVEFPPIINTTVTFVTIRAITKKGVVHFEANSEADLAVATNWAKRHRDTPPEEFTWLPVSTATSQMKGPV